MSYDLFRDYLPAINYTKKNLMDSDDPMWKKNIKANKILLLEPSHFEKYPISQKSVDFVINIAKINIPSIQIYVGEFKDFIKEHFLQEVYYKEHPTNSHYQGIEDSRDWMFEVNGYYSSFFSFWKKCKKELQ